MKIVRIQPTVNLEPVVLCPWISQVNHRLTDQSDVPWPLMVYHLHNWHNFWANPTLSSGFFWFLFHQYFFQEQKKSSQFWWSWKTRCLWIKCHTSLKKKDEMNWVCMPLHHSLNLHVQYSLCRTELRFLLSKSSDKQLQRYLQHEGEHKC